MTRGKIFIILLDMLVEYKTLQKFLISIEAEEHKEIQARLAEKKKMEKYLQKDTQSAMDIAAHLTKYAKELEKEWNAFENDLKELKTEGASPADLEKVKNFLYFKNKNLIGPNEAESRRISLVTIVKRLPDLTEPELFEELVRLYDDIAFLLKYCKGLANLSADWKNGYQEIPHSTKEYGIMHKIYLETMKYFSPA